MYIIWILKLTTNQTIEIHGQFTPFPILIRFDTIDGEQAVNIGHKYYANYERKERRKKYISRVESIEIKNEHNRQSIEIEKHFNLVS